ncbi:hypothetical protein C8R43DRAFT_950711 [Mycena crocata]|nr:hypothetical protein C8R43DRAFT_950711 [Mycena crocata]
MPISLWINLELLLRSVLPCCSFSSPMLLGHWRPGIRFACIDFGPWLEKKKTEVEGRGNKCRGHLTTRNHHRITESREIAERATDLGGLGNVLGADQSGSVHECLNGKQSGG